MQITVTLTGRKITIPIEAGDINENTCGDCGALLELPPNVGRSECSSCWEQRLCRVRGAEDALDANGGDESNDEELYRVVPYFCN